MTGLQAKQIYDLWVDRCRKQLESGAAGHALSAWMQAEGLSAPAAAEILRLAQAEPAAIAEQPGLESSAPTVPAPTENEESETSEARIASPVNPIDSPRLDNESPAAPVPDVEAQRARAHENAAAAFARAFSKSARLSRGGASPVSPAAGTNSAQAAHDTPRVGEPAPQAAPAQPSPPDALAHPTPPPDTQGETSSAPRVTSMGARPPSSEDPMETPPSPATLPAAGQLPEPDQSGLYAHSEAQGADYQVAQEPAVNGLEDNGMPGAVHPDKTADITMPGSEPAAEMDEGSLQPHRHLAESIQVDEGGAQHTVAPNETGPGAQPGSRMPDQDAIETVGVDFARQDEFDDAANETPAHAQETMEDPSPGSIARAPEPGSTIADPSAAHEPTPSQELPDEPVSPAVESRSAEREPPTGEGGNLTDDVLPDVAERVVGPTDEDSTAIASESVAGPDEIFAAASNDTSKRRKFGRRKTAHPEPADDPEHGTPTIPNGDIHEPPAEVSTAEPAESEMMRLLDEADRAADSEPHTSPRLAKPKTDKELADAAKLLGISFRDDPKRPRAKLQLDEDDETVKAARQLGIRFREEPEKASSPDLEDPITRAALEMGISFRDANRPSSDQKSTLRRYWPIVVVLALAAIAMPIAAVMLMFMGKT